MSEHIIITSDSSTDLGQELIKEHDIKIVPLRVSLGEQSYFDGVDISPRDIYRYYEENGELPKTSSVNILEYENFFSRYSADDTEVLHFSLSSELSSTYQNACAAAASFPNVHVVDTRSLSTGGGLLVMMAVDLVREGMKSAREIAEICRKAAARVDASFVIESLEFLKKGGRCSALAALGANLLKIKPCIVLKNGRMQLSRKYRGTLEKVQRLYIADQLSEPETIDTDRVFITHTGCDESLVEGCRKVLSELLPFKEVLVTVAGSTITSHAGSNTLGILFMRKECQEECPAEE